MFALPKIFLEEITQPQSIAYCASYLAEAHLFMLVNIVHFKRLFYVLLLLKTNWGIGAVGSAPHWQCGGHGFKSRMLHFVMLN